MRTHVVVIGLIALSLSSAGYAAYEFYVKVKGVARDAPAGPVYLLIETANDLDGDGAVEEGVVRLVCAKGEVQAVSFHYNVKSPRGAASGQASGRRTVDTSIAAKEWLPVPPQIASIGLPKITPKIAKEHHGKFRAAVWQPVTISDGTALCAGTAEAVQRHIKAKSNITNN